MNSPVNPCLHFLSLVLLLIFFVRVGANPDAWLDSCQSTFSCGNITGIDYPFRGYSEPEFCGHPGLVLDCQDNTVTTIQIKDLTFRVLDIKPDSQVMRIARRDVMESACPQDMVNTTLDYSIFQYASGYINLTFLYNCPGSFIPPGINPVPICQGSGYKGVGVYALPGTMGPGSCDASVTVPVSGPIESGNWTTDVGQALRQGFQVRWTVNTKICDECTRSKGRCGVDGLTNKTICYCPDPPFLSDSSCPVASGDPAATAAAAPPPSPGNSSSSPGQTNNTKIALFIAGAVLAGIGLGWIIFACRQRRKRRAAAESQSALPPVFVQDRSKGLPSPPLSKGLSNAPSSNFSQSIPSYPSSKSEFGKSTYFGVQVFSYAELEEATQSFDPSRELGDGGFGTVYYGKLQDGRVVAVKRLYENNFKRVEQFMNEVEILTRLRHDNLVTLYGCTSKRSRELLLVYEYIPNGTVADHLHGKRANSGLLSWPVRLNIALETAGALAYLHESDIIHRDVKTNNILLENDFHVKVADFGLSRLFPNDVTHVSTAPQGTPGYVDPEYYQCYQLTEKSDVYSFGVVLIELISSKQAVDTNRDRQDINLANMAVNKIQNHALHELVDPSLGFEMNGLVRRMTTLVAELAFRCLQHERDMRPSMKEVLEALKRIKNEESNAQKAEVVDIVIDDDAGALKANPPPMSPDSVVAEKWVGSSTTTPHSSD